MSNTQISSSSSKRVEDLEPTSGSRKSWLEARLRLEKSRTRSHPRRAISRFEVAGNLFKILYRVLKGLGLAPALKSTVTPIQLTEETLVFPNLPPAFDGFRILHLTDLHLDFVPEIAKSIISILPKEVDLAVFTGDYREEVRGSYYAILPALSSITNAISAHEGVWGVLGNHDCASMVGVFEGLGIQMLVNESTVIRRKKDSITLVGLDDVHYFYTPEALKTFKVESPFKIALVHSNEVADDAAREGVSLYLCGHTHGGQICLPNGKPLLHHTDQSRDMASGRWQKGKMQGYTNRGAGAVAIPLRLFCPGEVVVYTLKKGEK